MSNIQGFINEYCIEIYLSVYLGFDCTELFFKFSGDVKYTANYQRGYEDI